MGMTTYFFLFDSKHKCRLVKGETEDGEGKVGNKKFIVDGTEPLMLNKSNPITGDSYYPLYLVKWDDPQPKTLSEIPNLDEVDIESGDVTPDVLKSLSETNLLKGLFGQSLVSDENKQKIMLFIGVLGVAGVIVYLIWFGGLM